MIPTLPEFLDGVYMFSTVLLYELYPTKPPRYVPCPCDTPPDDLISLETVQFSIYIFSTIAVSPLFVPTSRPTADFAFDPLKN